MKTKIVILAGMLMLAAGQMAVAQRTITGNITAVEDGNTIPGVNVAIKGSHSGVISDSKGHYSIAVPDQKAILVFSLAGFKTKEILVGKSSFINVTLVADIKSLREVITSKLGASLQGRAAGVAVNTPAKTSFSYSSPTVAADQAQPDYNTEEYDVVNENIFHDALKNPLSTFSIDVDAAAYSNVRRFINNGQQPPRDAVRIEEMINYFHYSYPQPDGEDPFSINTEISTAPWNPKHKLVSIGLQGKNIPTSSLPPSNLVFLIDVSGSMSDPNKLPLLTSSFKLLVGKLREQDRVAIVVYSGAAGLVLPSTSGADKSTIIAALNGLQSGGSTAGGAGIELAYMVAKQNFRKEGNNRVILATDGDFNVGESSNSSMEQLITEKRNDGIFLTVLGFGMGNYKDSKMEILADKGNGNYAYIDTFQEAQKVLVSEFGGTLFTIAKDVKLQVEFNPAKVKAYRLLGYENRILRNEDFNNDKKDAGELGSGHTVTALYEIVPVGVESEFFKTDDLKYQTATIDPVATGSNEIMTVKFRYKKPDGNTSNLIVHPLIDTNLAFEKTSENFRWATAVAGFGMILRQSEFVGDFNQDDVLKLAKGARGEDQEGYRNEFIKIVGAQELMAKK